MKVNFFAIIALLLISNLSFAQADIPTTISMGLNLPLKNRIEVIQKTGRLGFKNLQELIFDKKQPMQIRWRALTSISLAYGDTAKEVVIRASKADEWFLRNAAVIAAKYCERPFAIQVANHMLNDKALVVRTAAVDSLIALKAINSKSTLWQQLNNQKNFRKNKSLWVRHNIVRALVGFAKHGDEHRFVRLLEDEDIRVKRQAVKGLEKLIGVRLAKRKPIDTKALAWKKWWYQKLN